MVNLKFLQIVVKSAWQGTKVQAKGHEVYFLYFEIYFLLLTKIKPSGRFIFLELPDYIRLFVILTFSKYYMNLTAFGNSSRKHK